MSKNRYLTQLRQNLSTYFDEEELVTLCFDLGVQYENLPARGKANKARDLVSLMARSGRIPELVALCEERRPKVGWTFQARLFVSYKRHSEPDETLARFLHQHLLAEGHQAFIDQTMRSGTEWLKEIDQQIKESDFLVALLSPASADSEMVQAEVQRAYNYRKQQGYPDILPVRVSFEGLLPYSIDAFLSPYQYSVWDSPADNASVARSISDAIHGRITRQEPIAADFGQADVIVSEDGRTLEHQDALHAPLPEFDPRILEDLVVPGGTVRLRDRLYVERKADKSLALQVSRPGSITTIRAPRQTGKSSLLVRGVHAAKEQGAHVVNLDLQRLDRDDMESGDTFLYYLAYVIARKLRLDPADVENMWKGPLGHQDKITYLMEEVVLPSVDSQLVLAMDEADRLLETDFHTGFFGLIRSWHNNAAYDPVWEKLNIILVISTEPYLLIANSNQSPFNVGLKLYLEDFDQTQVEDLNHRHGSPVQPADFPAFMRLLRGHPYLTRKALFILYTEHMSWADFDAVAASDQGPFGDHLRRQLWLLHDQPDLVATLKQILRQGRSDDQMALFRLVRAGLVRSSGLTAEYRCELYRRYFRKKLR